MLGRVFVLVYTRVYTRAGPYLVGIALGCVLAARGGKAADAADLRKLTEPATKRDPGRLALTALCWTVSAATCLAVLFGVAGFYQRDRPYSALAAGLYAGLHRTAWAAGVAWVVFACVSGRGGAVNAFLSWRLFAPLARLSYCVYLGHYAVIMVGHGLRRAPGYFGVFTTVSRPRLHPRSREAVRWSPELASPDATSPSHDPDSLPQVQDALGTLAISLAVAVVLSLSFEMPFMALDRALLPRGKRCSMSSWQVTYQPRALTTVPSPTGPSAKVPPSAPNVCTISSAEAGLASVAGREVCQPDLYGYDNAAFDKQSEK